MKKINALTVFICILICSMPVDAMSYLQPKLDSVYSTKSYLQQENLKPKNIEKRIGRKLKLKEKIALLLINHKLKKANMEGTKGSSGLLFAIGGLIFVSGGIIVALTSWNPILFGILIGLSAVCTVLAFNRSSDIKKSDPRKKKAKLAQIIAAFALAGLAFIVAGAFVALALLSSF